MYDEAEVFKELAPLLRVRPQLQQICRFGAQWSSQHEPEPEGWANPTQRSAALTVEGSEPLPERIEKGRAHSAFYTPATAFQLPRECRKRASLPRKNVLFYHHRSEHLFAGARDVDSAVFFYPMGRQYACVPPSARIGRPAI
jgi:hypothetical protein